MPRPKENIVEHNYEAVVLCVCGGGGGGGGECVLGLLHAWNAGI